jgi:hypothetical protein
VIVRDDVLAFAGFAQQRRGFGDACVFQQQQR